MITKYPGRKIVVVGAGAVGSTFCYALAQSGLADEIALIDINADLATAQVQDLMHGQPFFPALSMRVGNVEDYADADVIVITAGAAQQPGQTRLDLLKTNAAIVESIVADIVDQSSEALLLIVTNPVDVLTHIALKRSGWPCGRVVGSGTVLDSARLRHILSNHCGIDVHNVHAYMLGEHGDSEFAAWSMTNLAGIPIDSYCPACKRCADWCQQREQIEQQVRDSAYHIIDYKGCTHFGVGMALVRIVGAVLRSQNSVLTLSTYLDGEYGLEDVCLSVPCVVSRNGVDRIIESPLPKRELASLELSADIIARAFKQVSNLRCSTCS